MSLVTGSIVEENLHQLFIRFKDVFLSSLRSGEHARIAMSAEHTQFTRMNKGCVRQTGIVDDCVLKIEFFNQNQSTTQLRIPFVSIETDISETARLLLNRARGQADAAPRDPYASVPSEKSSSHVSHEGRLLASQDVVDALLGSLQPTDDLVGLYAGGKSIRALADSAGSLHWFSSESFFVDYSLWLANGRAVKAGYAGREWNQAEFLATLNVARQNLDVLTRPAKKLQPGSYRVFLAPSATSELLHMFSWGALSEGALQRNDSPLCAVRRGDKSFSPLFSLSENYQLGLAPRFSDVGELAPDVLPLIQNGRFVQALCSARTAKEYGVSGNGSGTESLRSPDMDVGELPTAESLKQLGTGLYLSDLHYLNWSDMIEGRVTGMTRYGCVWVENGVPVGPIQDMRFDDTLFRCFGSELVAVTREAQVIPETSTYGSRGLGGARVPGMLIRNFNFTL